ncbi:hypothetical protein LCGC14_2349640 [marine sediment metagenome]|uniref:Uncharacterized protein n=1 Tax=marine sediment metagenome TaxID=412755 RepID=A0A0F9CX16_9ZZZZ
MLNDRQKGIIAMMKKDRLPAIPPDDFKGSVANWHYALQEIGIWNGKDPSEIMDIMISGADYNFLLRICEDN